MSLRRTAMPRGAKPLTRKTPLAPASAKRAEAATNAGKPIRAAFKAPQHTGPDNLTVEAVWQRDEGRCGWCGRPIDPYGTRGFDWSVQHRRPRRRDGQRPDTNLPSNLELLHGSGTTLCHGEVENRRRGDAITTGHILHADAVPSQEPVEHAMHGWCYLTDDGAVSYAPPPVSRDGELDCGGYWDGAA